MAKQFKLTVEKRDLKGNKDIRQLRKDMKIPGFTIHTMEIIYYFKFQIMK